jgi:phosphoribosylaminoimidazole carboxylase (NCAIR synthetase)
MIAGTDQADRTLDAPDIFDFIQGKLATRFIRSAAELAPRIAAMDSLPDADGRYRVSEYYCHDTTWQQALHALVERCDVVLMDLRGFKAHNAGCLYELAALAQAARPLHVVVLHDATTERVAADAAIAGKAQRFVWIDASRINAQRRREVLARLFDYHRAAAAVPDAAAQPMG